MVTFVENFYTGVVMLRKLFIIMLAFSTSMIIGAGNLYVIYPVPHKQVIAHERVSFTKLVNVVAESSIDEVTVNRAKQVLADHGLEAKVSSEIVKDCSNVVLGVNGTNGVADQRATAMNLDHSVFDVEKYDRHILAMTAENGIAQVVILGENTDATFCGLASLEQMLDRGTADLPCVTLYDFADIKNRGIIEGYYGVPYSAEVTKDLFRFMARYKMNTYMYGAKSDPYHSRYWGDPYPITITPDEQRIGYLTQDMMRDITAVSHETKVNFIWAIHPGKAFANPDDTSVLDRIMAKFESMYQLGVRQFGVFVDDVGVPEDPAVMKLCADNISALQGKIDERWNKGGALAADMVKPLHYVPQLYAHGWVSLERAQEFYESLRNTPSKINIYITGRDVWSVPNNVDLERVSGWLGRNLSWWWNYPCNDQDHTKLFVMDTYTNFRDETHINSLARIEQNLAGVNTVIINPMQQGELAKIALFSVADYTWNNSAFHSRWSWEAAIPAVVGNERTEAFMKLAPYLRYYDNDALAYKINNYQASVKRGSPSPNALLDELREVNDACQVIKAMKNSSCESDRLFYNDIRPWLLKLDAMTAEAIALLEGKNPPAGNYSDNPDYQFETLGGMGERISLTVRTAEPSNVCLPELLKWLHEQAILE